MICLNGINIYIYQVILITEHRTRLARAAEGNSELSIDLEEEISDDDDIMYESEVNYETESDCEEDDPE